MRGLAVTLALLRKNRNQRSERLHNSWHRRASTWRLSETRRIGGARQPSAGSEAALKLGFDRNQDHFRDFLQPWPLLPALKVVRIREFEIVFKDFRHTLRKLCGIDMATVHISCALIVRGGMVLSILSLGRKGKIQLLRIQQE